jgi:DNA-binding IclR family transcriptional regulator
MSTDANLIVEDRMSPLGGTPGSAPALDRALDILELLSRSPAGQTLSELSEQLQLPKNSVFRITQTLLARGYLVRDSDTLAFRLTSRLLRLAPPRWGSVSLPAISREAMIALRDKTRETVQLGVLSGLEGVIIDQVEGLEPLRISVDLGLRFSLHNNAPGKLLLAYSPVEQRNTLLARIKLPPTTSRTITTKSELLAECNRILECGYSVDFAESDEGIHCVAAPIFDANETVVAALWVSGPAKRLPKSKFRELGAQVSATSSRISRTIGGLG